MTNTRASSAAFSEGIFGYTIRTFQAAMCDAKLEFLHFTCSVERISHRTRMFPERRMKASHLVAAMILTGMTAMPVQAEPSTTEQVKTWSLRQWNRAVTEYRKDKVKSTSCRKQSADMKLKGKASWS